MIVKANTKTNVIDSERAPGTSHNVLDRAIPTRLIAGR
jgi:hypothetical protein